MCEGLMFETFWSRPPTTIDMYAIKKHMEDRPELFKDTSITNMNRRDYE
jgi:hypothetical protein